MGSESTTNRGAKDDPIDIAVIGGGIIGHMVAVGLLRRGMRVTIYEQSDELHEVSAGFAFTGVARECMTRLAPSLLDALQRVGEVNRHSHNRYWDGFNPRTKDAAESQEALLFQVSARNLNYQGCLRSHLLREMEKECPEGTIKFGKKLMGYVDDESHEKVTLIFSDGSTAQAGCGQAVVPIADAANALGKDKANNQCMHMGSDGVVISYPADREERQVAQWTLLNLAIFLHDPEPWSSAKTTMPGTRDEVRQRLSQWSPGIREIIEALPEHLTRWGVFDMADQPASTYARGRVCIGGDAAHASSPFLGAGACMGVEDALVLATVLDMAAASIRRQGPGVKASALSAAFQAYSAVRLPRSQWLVQSSREMGELYQWRHPEAGSDAERCGAMLEARTRGIWDFDVDEMMAETAAEFERRLEK
ncbi:hypothetical protein ACHAQH_008450 [Verticillium albo-atrum]